jgi:hypothetical protein
MPANIVDWVLLELRTDILGSTRIARRAALIRSDGKIVDVDGSGPVSFPGVGPGNYYIVLFHRNHLAAMSAGLVSVGNSIADYDFTTGLGKNFASNTKNLGGGVFGLFAGDYSEDGFIDASDFTGPDNDVFRSGYRRSDLNLDGFVDSDDFLPTDNNVFRSTSVLN